MKIIDFFENSRKIVRKASANRTVTYKQTKKTTTNPARKHKMKDECEAND